MILNQHKIEESDFISQIIEADYESYIGDIMDSRYENFKDERMLDD